MDEPKQRVTKSGRLVHTRRFDHLPAEHWYQVFNRWFAIKVTKAVGSMYCAYLFALFDMLALPTAIGQGLYGIVQWVASFFLQLVLLSVIMVGQNITGEAADVRSEKTFEDTERILDRLDLRTQGGIAELHDHVMARLDQLEERIGRQEEQDAAGQVPPHQQSPWD